MSKIERGFKTDIEDVAFMLRKTIIELEQLSDMAEAMLPRARESSIWMPDRYGSNLKLLRKRKK